MACYIYWLINFNAEKRAKIPEFSNLDDIGIPLRLFELFFDDAIVNMIVH